MTKTTFDVQTDHSGRENVYRVSDELNKNHHESAVQDATIDKARMYPRPGNSICPVLSFQKYLNKLYPDLDAMATSM